MEKRQTEQIQQEQNRDKRGDTSPPTEEDLLGPPTAIAEQLSDKGANARALTSIDHQFGIMDKLPSLPLQPDQEFVLFVGIETLIETAGLAENGRGNTEVAENKFVISGLPEDSVPTVTIADPPSPEGRCQGKPECLAKSGIALRRKGRATNRGNRAVSVKWGDPLQKVRRNKGVVIQKKQDCPPCLSGGLITLSAGAGPFRNQHLERIIRVVDFSQAVESTYLAPRFDRNYD
jgi:hypothetical protein